MKAEIAGAAEGVRAGEWFALARVGALTLHRATRAQVVDAVFAALARGEGGSVVTANLDFVQRAVEEPELAELYGRATLRVADGMPVLWLARLAGEALPERVAGSDLVWSLAERAAREQRSIFLLGGSAGPGSGAVGAAQGARRVLSERFPTLRIVGASSPQLSSPPLPEELAAVRADLISAQPDLVYCAFGTPKQEQVAAQLAPALPRAWWLGCGISLSFISGERTRAPAWVQRFGLEWLHRTAQEPGRLAHRYLVRNLPFLMKTALRQLLAPRRQAA